MAAQAHDLKIQIAELAPRKIQIAEDLNVATAIEMSLEGEDGQLDARRQKESLEIEQQELHIHLGQLRQRLQAISRDIAGRSIRRPRGPVVPRLDLSRMQ